jgi:hypothetical protein
VAYSYELVATTGRVGRDLGNYVRIACTARSLLTVLDRETDLAALNNDVVAGIPERVDPRWEMLFLDQHVVGVKRRNRKNAKGCFSKRLQDREQDTGEGELERTDQLQARPTVLDGNPARNSFTQTHNRQFLRRPAYGEEPGTVSPRRNIGIGTELGHGKRTWDGAEFEGG